MTPLTATSRGVISATDRRPLLEGRHCDGSKTVLRAERFHEHWRTQLAGATVVAKTVRLSALPGTLPVADCPFVITPGLLRGLSQSADARPFRNAYEGSLTAAFRVNRVGPQCVGGQRCGGRAFLVAPKRLVHY